MPGLAAAPGAAAPDTVTVGRGRAGGQSQALPVSVTPAVLIAELDSSERPGRARPRPS